MLAASKLNGFGFYKDLHRDLGRKLAGDRWAGLSYEEGNKDCQSGCHAVDYTSSRHDSPARPKKSPAPRVGTEYRRRHSAPQLPNEYYC